MGRNPRDGRSTVPGRIHPGAEAWDRAVCEALDEAESRKVEKWADKLNRDPAISVEGFFESRSR